MDNKVYENIMMVARYDWVADAYLGHIELKHLPVPGSVTVYLQGHLIEPESFDACGNPIISEEMTKFFISHQSLNFRNDPTNNTEDIYARVCYEPLEISAEKDDFDSVNGIQKSLQSLKDFNNMLCNRVRYYKAFGDAANLTEYVLWNKYILDKFGKIQHWNGEVRNPSTRYLSIMRAFSALESFPDVYEVNALNVFLDSDEHLAYDCEFHVPADGSICPICGRKFSMYDICTKEFLRINGKHCHKKCFEDYEKALQFERIINLVVQIYDNNPKYTVIENTSYRCLTLSFETPDGELQIQDSSGCVYIEWQESFSSFDMAIFEKEEEIKWWSNTDNKPIFLGKSIPKNLFTHHIRGIMARCNYNRAARYLQLAKDAANKTK